MLVYQRVAFAFVNENRFVDFDGWQPWNTSPISDMKKTPKPSN